MPLPEIEQLYRRAIELEEKLVADSPSVPAYRRRLAGSMNNLGLHFLDRDPPQARKAIPPGHRNRRQAFGRLSARGRVPTLTSAMARNNLGYLLEQMGRPAAAEQEYRSARLRGGKAGDRRDFRAGISARTGEQLRRVGRSVQVAGRPIEAEHGVTSGNCDTGKTAGPRVAEHAGLDYGNEPLLAASRFPNGRPAREAGRGAKTSARPILDYSRRGALPLGGVEGCHRGTGKVDAVQRA